MKNRAVFILSLLIVFTFAYCSKNENRTPNFFVNFATVTKNESSLIIHLDNGETLIPSSSDNYLDIKDSSRVIIRYTPLEDNFIKVHGIQQIFLGDIEDKNIEALNSEPLKKVVVDKQGGYLNLQFLVDYHSKPHSVSLFRDINSQDQDKTNLYLSYSRKDDPPGAPTKMYISFKLGKLKNNKINIFIETDEGKRRYDR